MRLCRLSLNSAGQKWGMAEEPSTLRFSTSIEGQQPAHVDWLYWSAPVAQLDRAIASGAIGREFESLRAHQIIPRAFNPSAASDSVCSDLRNICHRLAKATSFDLERRRQSVASCL